MIPKNTIFKLTGKVQNYAWGGSTYIPNLLHIENTQHKPFAEYWMGAHSSAPSNVIILQENISLKDLIHQNPVEILGEEVYQHFNELPFLFKILDVHDMLSIQVHPSKTEAAKGFAAEEAAGIPINAANRNYKDQNHKPEVMVALSEFWLLHGFKNIDAIENTLTEIKEFNVLLALFRSASIKGLYQFLMEMDQSDVDNILLPIVKKELRQKREGLLAKSQPGWWVAKLYEQTPINELNNLDRGIFSIYLFNIVCLQKDEAIFQAAGIPHAYLEGQNVELMANSDNVLRGGLTNKHIDVPELLKHTAFQSITPKVLKGEKLLYETIYPCPVPDFAICKIDLNPGEVYFAEATSVEIFFVIEGAIIVKGQENMFFKKGDAFTAFANTNYHFTSSGTTTIFKAYVPN
jgi:mannose-6-phosphate isomerase